MRRTERITYIVILLIIPLLSISQNSNYIKKEKLEVYSHYIFFNPTRLFLNELRFGYEYEISSLNSLRLIIGVKIPESTDDIIMNDIIYAPLYYSVTNGFYVGLASNFYGKKSSKNYFSAEIYHFYDYYDNKYYFHCTGTSGKSAVSYESMKRSRIGAKVFINRNLIYKINKNIGMKFEFYAGIGLQYAYKMEITKHGSSYTGDCNKEDVNLFNTPTVENNPILLPTIHLGIRLGVPFNIN